MAEELIHVRIETPEKAPIHRDAERALIWSKNGLLEILPEHGAMVFELGTGIATLFHDENEENISLYGGLAHIKHDELTILTLNSEKPEEIDEERARDALSRYKRRKDGADPELRDKADQKRLEQSRERAEIRLKLKGM
jgi:F-type H+-transporting ATPase subunit epsilon